MGERQLRRLFLQHLGAPPVSVAQTRRVLFAKQLIHETQLPMTEVALAAGFGSLRRFNETFQELFQRPPMALRRKTSNGHAGAGTGVTLRIRYRSPYDWDSILAFFQARSIPGVEVVENGHYLRTVDIDGLIGSIEVAHHAERQSLGVTIRFPSVKSLPTVVGRVRRLFDVGADIETIDAHLSSDPFLAPLVAQRPGLRAPGGWDGFEIAVRAILGQQISVAAARRLAGQLVALHGKDLPMEQRVHPGLIYVFPTSQRLASVKSLGLSMPVARQFFLKAIAEATVADPNLFHPLGSIEETVERLRMIPGVGDWTAHYIALRAIRETDAFPASDIGLLRSAGAIQGEKSTTAHLLDRARSWRPWRAYAAQHLWAAGPVAPSKGVSVV
ncbi:AlkA N-terminal domain-containing protein [Granulicella sp. dw_53]|uniref:DNA-3-methyladenine glycosylase 2 n=1 Tax=Granulicella sp. dw_53 TaxID=2719792 RepID=UPI0021046070|nr:AlkA N-terminal domain-containing protein [Granulicella sp. dw_53]